MASWRSHAGSKRADVAKLRAKLAKFEVENNNINTANNDLTSPLHQQITTITSPNISATSKNSPIMPPVRSNTAPYFHPPPFPPSKATQAGTSRSIKIARLTTTKLNLTEEIMAEAQELSHMSDRHIRARAAVSELFGSGKAGQRILKDFESTWAALFKAQKISLTSLYIFNRSDKASLGDSTLDAFCVAEELEKVYLGEYDGVMSIIAEETPLPDGEW